MTRAATSNEKKCSDQEATGHLLFVLIKLNVCNRSFPVMLSGSAIDDANGGLSLAFCM
jgi:hypothetical protein